MAVAEFFLEHIRRGQSDFKSSKNMRALQLPIAG